MNHQLGARWLPSPAATLLAPLLLSAFVLATAARAQDAAPVTLAGTQQVDLVSDVNGRSYRLYIAPPEDYAADDTTRYPVLYLLDGYRSFPAALSARAFKKTIG